MFAALKWSCFLLVWVSGIFSQPLLQNAAVFDIDLVAEESDTNNEYARAPRSPKAEYDFHRLHGFHGQVHDLHGHHHYHHGHGSGEFHSPNYDFHPHAHGRYHFDRSSECDYPSGFDKPHSFDLHQGHRHHPPYYPSHELEDKTPQTDQRHPVVSDRSQLGLVTTPQPPASLPTSSLSISLPALPSSSSYTTTTAISSSPSSWSSTASTAMPDKTEATDLEYNIDLRFGD